MHTLILSAAGNSTRFPNTRPKWALTHPNGNLMAVESIRNIYGHDRLLVLMRSSHLAKYSAEAVQREFKLAGHEAEIIDVGETESQVASVANGITRGKVRGRFTVKDCDNQFGCILPDHNAVACVPLAEVRHVIPGNKSYVKLEGEYITDIAEKQIISNLFSCGAYTFSDPVHFVTASPGEEYLSGVIRRMVINGFRFVAPVVNGYEDWGTEDDWRRYVASYKTLFVDIDGVLVRSSHRSFSPRWGETELIQENVDFVNSMHATGRVYVVLVTSRPDSHHDATLKQLAGVKYDKLLMGLPNAARVMVNDYGALGLTCYAINVERDVAKLRDAFRRELL